MGYPTKWFPEADNKFPINGQIMNGGDPPFWLLFGPKAQLLAVTTTPWLQTVIFLCATMTQACKYGISLILEELSGLWASEPTWTGLAVDR